MIDGHRDRRSQIVGAAFAAVAEVGFEGLRLRRVAAEVGLDQSTLHHYFATKAHLVEAVAHAMASRFAAAAPPHGAAPDEALGAHLAELAHLVRTEPDLFTVSAELDLHGRRDPAVRRVLDAVEEGWRRALSAVLHDDDAVELVIATVKGVRLSPEHADPVLRRLTQLLTGGPP